MYEKSPHGPGLLKPTRADRVQALAFFGEKFRKFRKNDTIL